jgi:hypothetical protein
LTITGSTRFWPPGCIPSVSSKVHAVHHPVAGQGNKKKRVRESQLLDHQESKYNGYLQRFRLSGSSKFGMRMRMRMIQLHKQRKEGASELWNHDRL